MALFFHGGDGVHKRIDIPEEEIPKKLEIALKMCDGDIHRALKWIEERLRDRVRIA